MFKKAKHTHILVFLLFTLMLITMVGCNKNEEVIILSDDVTLSLFKTNASNIVNYSVNPYVEFASNKKVESVKLVGYDVMSVDGIKCHSVSLDFTDLNLKPSKTYGDYYIYSCVFKPKVGITGYEVGNEKVLISDFKLEIDGNLYTSKMKYYLHIFEIGDEVSGTWSGSITGNKAEGVPVELLANSAIDIVSINFIDDAVIFEHGIKNGNEISFEDVLSSMPKHLDAGENYGFIISVKLKQELTSGSGYFVVNYKTEGSEDVKQLPFGIIYFDYDTNIIASELLS